MTVLEPQSQAASAPTCRLFYRCPPHAHEDGKPERVLPGVTGMIKLPRFETGAKVLEKPIYNLGSTGQGHD